MPADFHRTLRALEEDRPLRPALLFLPAAVLLLAWGAWLAAGEVALHELIEDGLVEVELAAHPIGAPRDGRLVALDARLGRDVEEGELLALYDAHDVELGIEAAKGRIAALEARLEAAERELEAREEAQASLAAATGAQRAEALAKAEEGRALVQALARRATTLETLASEGRSSRESALDARAEAQSAAARAHTLELSAERIGPEAEVGRRDREVASQMLRRELAELVGELSAGRAELARLERERSERSVRAPISGRIGEESPLRAGSVVRLGERITLIVPEGRPRIRASFPASAVGRVRVGQAARLRFEGFPWTRYGFRHATVASVGSPGAGGRVPVELEPRADERSPIPLDHGLACTAEVEVERASPLDLVLRSAGRLLTGARAEGAPR